MRRVIFLVVFGLGGLAILLWLGTWQVQRLAWKEAMLQDITDRIAAEPVPLPDLLETLKLLHMNGPLTGPDIAFPSFLLSITGARTVDWQPQRAPVHVRKMGLPSR